MSKLREAIKYYKDHPLEYVQDIIKAVPTRQQEQVLKVIPQAIIEGKGIAVKSGHGVGKTALESWIIQWWNSTRPFPKIPCTAPTQHQLFDILWSELAKWNKQAINESWFEWTKTHFYNKEDPENWFAVARASSKPENMQGFHSEHLLFVIDEASGVAQDIMEVIEGALTQEGSLMMMFGNPTKLSGSFYDAFNIKKEFFYTFTFSSEDSILVKDDFGKKIIRKYGRDSDVYRVRVLGLFPKAESDAMISLGDVMDAAHRQLPRLAGQDCEIGVDVARFGDDETVIAVRTGMIVHPLISFGQRDTMYVAGKVSELVKEYQGAYNVSVNVDDTGVGGGVTDRLNQLVKDKAIKCNVVPVNNGERAFDFDSYVNKGSEMWWWLGRNIGDVELPDDEELENQLSTRRYSFDTKNRIGAEPKKEMKKRGLTSPDRGDAVVLCFHGLIENSDSSYDPCIA